MSEVRFLRNLGKRYKMSFNMLKEKEFPTNRSLLNETLEKKVEKHLHPSDDFISLTDIASSTMMKILNI